MGYYKWIPASAGMTQESAGMMGGMCKRTIGYKLLFPPPIKTFEGMLQWGSKRRFQLEFTPMNFGKESISRNLIIADMFHRMAKVEKIGSGIKRMRDFMRKAGLKEPNFEMTNFFRVIFYRSPEYALKQAVVKTTQKTTQKILELVRQNPSITREELAKAIGLSDSGIKFSLNKMKKKNLLRRIGPDKGGHWKAIRI